MDFDAFRQHVNQIEYGKKLPDAIYVHTSAVPLLPVALKQLIQNICKGVKIKSDTWNIAKFLKRDFRIALLHYPDFDSHAYPALHESINIDLQKLSVRTTNYRSSPNPPILHRKETFVSPSYHKLSEFIAITAEGEEIGLYEGVRKIGFRENWLKLVRAKGYTLDDYGRLVESRHLPSGSEINVQRHLTAIDRNTLSSPFSLLSKYGYLDGNLSIFDYGCGKGDDVRQLEAAGLDVASFDPVYHPEGEPCEADIVNLGFVINVIEDKDERAQTLIKAFSLTRHVLVVSAMIASEAMISQFTPYKDGVITSKKTFQKYYAQSELKEYIARTLEVEPIALGQGVFIAFRDQNHAQGFLLKQQSFKREWSINRETKANAGVTPNQIKKHEILFKDFWKTSLDLGRCPANDEFDQTEMIRRVAGSHKKAFDALLEHKGEEQFASAKRFRKEDLLVYFALGLFEKRKASSRFPKSLQRDLKALFDSYSHARALANELLFSLSDVELIESTCQISHSRIQSGVMLEGHSFIFHQSYLPYVTPELRAYIGCGALMVGDISEYQLVKAHIQSGKVTFMRYDNWRKRTPLLLERVKVKLRELDVDFFDYTGNYEPQPLENKKEYR